MELVHKYQCQCGWSIHLGICRVYERCQWNELILANYVTRAVALRHTQNVCHVWLISDKILLSLRGKSRVVWGYTRTESNCTRTALGAHVNCCNNIATQTSILFSFYLDRAEFNDVECIFLTSRPFLKRSGYFKMYDVFCRIHFSYWTRTDDSTFIHLKKTPSIGCKDFWRVKYKKVDRNCSGQFHGAPRNNGRG